MLGSCSDGLRIPIYRQQATRRSELIQNRACVASPSERSVHIAAIRFKVQARYRRAEQNRHVLTGTFSFFVHSAGAALQGERLELS